MFNTVLAALFALLPRLSCAPRTARLVALLVFCHPVAVRAQSAESEMAPARGAFTPAPLPPTAFIVPDVSDSLVAQAQVKSHWFSMKIGLVALVDYNAFDQDAQNIAQVGTQRDQWDDRSERLMLRGTLGTKYKVNYLFAAEYKGFETDPEDLWSLTDLSFTLPIGGPGTKLTIGKTKETFCYEMVGDAANLPHLERVLNPFFVSRNIGVKVMRVLGADHRMTASAGVFNDWFVTGQSLAESGTTTTARVTGLVLDKNEGKRFLHLGLAGRYVGADKNSLRLKGRPESNVTDPFVDTGNMPAESTMNVGTELLWNEGPVSVLAEYASAWVNSKPTGDPAFSGYYATASWVITGETRPYDRTVGYARRVMPTKKWGAPELVARYSHVDLVDAAVQGGSFNKTYLGMNWWATKRWKMGAGWGHTWLDRSATTGTMEHIIARLQWVY